MVVPPVTRFARAALGFGWSFRVIGVDHERIAVLEEALALLPVAEERSDVAHHGSVSGPLDAVEPLAEAALRLGERVEPENAQQAYSALLFCLRREQGRLAEFLPVIEAIVAQPDTIPGWRRALAIIYLELGRLDDANREMDMLRPTDTAIDGQLNGLTLMAEVSAGLRRTQECAAIYELLQPYAKQGIVLGMGITHFGSASRYLGLLATALARFDDAERHFADAMAMHERLRSPG